MNRLFTLLSFLSLSLYFTGCTKGGDTPEPTPPVSQTVSVTGVSATSLAEGDTLIISGKNFNPSVSGNVVKVNGITVTIISATATDLTIQIPVGTVSGNMAIAVTCNGQTGTYSFSFTRLGTLITILKSPSIILPAGIAVDKAGNLYISDPSNYCIRKMTPQGVVSVYAGFTTNGTITDGPVATATFRRPGVMTIDKAGNLYVVDNYTNLRKISGNGDVTTFAAGLPIVDAMTFDFSGNLYIVSTQGATIRKVMSDGTMNVIIDGLTGYPDVKGGMLKFMQPKGITCDPAGNLYVVDQFNRNIRKITPAGNVTTIGGGIGTTGNADGPLAVARFSQLTDITIDPNGNLYVLDYGNKSIRKIDPAGMVTTVAGKKISTTTIDGNLDIATLGYYPDGYIAADPAGNLFITEVSGSKIRKVTF